MVAATVEEAMASILNDAAWSGLRNVIDSYVPIDSFWIEALVAINVRFLNDVQTHFGFSFLQMCGVVEGLRIEFELKKQNVEI